MNAQELTLAGIAVTPLILGLVELAKVYMPTRFAPLLALALGIAAGVATQATLPHPIWLNGVVIGVAEGLAASGLYSGIGALQSWSASSEPTPPLPPRG